MWPGVRRASGPTVAPALARAREALAARAAADLELAEAALEWALAHPMSAAEAADSERLAVLEERPRIIAGAGAPAVAEFACVDFGAALGWSAQAAESLMADVLDLAFRLPRVWDMVGAGRIALHVGRMIAELSRDLDESATDHADRLIEWLPQRLSRRRVKALVDEARLYADPDRAIHDHDEALQARKVEVTHTGAGTGLPPDVALVEMVLDAGDAVAFDTQIGVMAKILAGLGDQGDGNVRRARAVGILADPQRALDLLAADTHPEAHAAAEEAASAPGRLTSGGGRAGSGSDVSLVLHVDAADLVDQLGPGHARGGNAIVRSGRIGPQLMRWLNLWLLGSQVTVTPVLRTGPAEPTVAARDCHDPGPRMTALIRERDPVCVFPGCQTPSAHCDLDHIAPYTPPDEGGSLGQTNPDNLAPLCRRHHRAKTFTRWRYQREPDGSYDWTSPMGERFTIPPTKPRPRPR